MTIEQQLKELILSRYENVIDFTKKIGMPNSTFASILHRGVSKASVNNIIKICQELEISADELSNGKIVPQSHPKEIEQPQDIQDVLSIAKMNIAYKKLTLDGEPLTKDDIEIIFDAIDFSLKVIRKQHQRSRSENEA
jgi:DNA-binding Xre family transcriptional regulator